jgi:hypothetical protein
MQLILCIAVLMMGTGASFMLRMGGGSCVSWSDFQAEKGSSYSSAFDLYRAWWKQYIPCQEYCVRYCDGKCCKQNVGTDWFSVISDSLQLLSSPSDATLSSKCNTIITLLLITHVFISFII